LAIVLNTCLNNYYLSRFEKQLFDFPLPTGTVTLKKNSKIGVLTGNGNHCDFVASLEIKTDLTVAQIEGLFKNMTIKPAVSGSSTQQGIIVESISSGIKRIEIWDAPGQSGFDLRCT